MKYVVLCPDGAADWPIRELDNKTPLEAAKLPYWSKMAAEGMVGRTQHAVESVGNGSDVCCMSLLGFDPTKFHTGRAPLEAKSAGLDLADDEIAVRCNTVTVENEIMVDYSAGHISTGESRKLINDVQEALGQEGLRFHPGVQYRHILVLKRSEPLDAICTAPHDITGRDITNYLPRGADAAFLLDLMNRSKAVLKDHPVNRERTQRKENLATQIWLWGHGRRPNLPSFQETFGIKGAMISAVDLLRSLGMYMGLEVLDVPGITGFIDTDYAAKGKAALETLNSNDLVFVHVEAPDECGHMGDARKKVESLERIDSEIIKPILESDRARNGELRILVCPDHSTPCALKAHATEPIPFLVWGAGVEANNIPFEESAARQAPVLIDRGYELMGRFLKIDF